MANNINNTSHSVSEQVPQVDISRAVPLSVILLLIDLATVIGNSLVILAVVYDYSLRSMATNFYVVSLAVADLMIGVFVLPFSSTYEILGYWIFGQYFCVIWAMVDVLCCTASILSLVAISLDRYMAISRPMQYPRFSTSKVAGLCIFGVWFLATAISIPPLFGWRSERTDYSQCELTSGKGYVTYSASGSFYIPSIVLIFVYSRIYVVAAKHTRDIKKGQIVGELRTPDYEVDGGRESAPSQLFNVKSQYRPSNVSSASQEPFLMDHKHRERETLAKRLKKFTKEKRAAKTLAIVVGAFLMCWSPFFLVYLIRGVCDSCDVPESVFKTFFWLGYCNSFLNPIIYPCLNKDFKRAFKRIFQRTYCNRYSIDFYDSPRRSMRVIRASRKLRMSMPDSRSSSSPPDSPNLALARRQSIFKEMQIRRASANLLNSKEKHNNVKMSNYSNCQPIEHFQLSQVEHYDTSPRRPSMPTKIFSYPPPRGRSFATPETLKESLDVMRDTSGSIVSINGNARYHFPFYSAYFHSEPNICDVSTKISDNKQGLQKVISKHGHSEDELNLSLLDVPKVLDGELSRPVSHYNCQAILAQTPDEGHNGLRYNICATRKSLDTSDSYFWNCIAQLRRKSAEARASQKLGLHRVASCEYELSQQHHATLIRDPKNRSPFFLSLCQLNLSDADQTKLTTQLQLGLRSDKSVQTMLTNQHFNKGQVSLNCRHCDIK